MWCFQPVFFVCELWDNGLLPVLCFAIIWMDVDINMSLLCLLEYFKVMILSPSVLQSLGSEAMFTERKLG